MKSVRDGSGSDWVRSSPYMETADQSSISPAFWSVVRATATEVRGAFLSMPDEPYRGAKGIFPQVWCEWGSIALAEVLVAHELGEWTFVEMKLPDSPPGHSWIELRGDRSTALFTIDITLDQFPEWDDWYLGTAPTPVPLEVQPDRLCGTLARLAGGRHEFVICGVRREDAPVRSTGLDGAAGLPT